MKFDLIIIGGGVIGLTIANQALIKNPSLKVAILEKEKSIGQHASGRNSGVLHTGIYYPHNTLKAKYCKLGSELMAEYARDNSIPIRTDGKVIVAKSKTNSRGYAQLLENAKNNNINAELLDEKEVKKIEPYAKAEFGGIYCKDTAVINSKQVLKSLVSDLKKRGAKLFIGEEVISIENQACQVKTTRNSFQYDFLVNAAGAFADRVAQMMNVGEVFKLIPFKGIYYKLKKEYSHKVRGSIYPVPDPSLPFLGIHFTRVIDGSVYVGPTAIPALGRENYNFLEKFKPKEAIDTFSNLLSLYIRNQQNFRNLTHKEIPHLAKNGVLKSASYLLSGVEKDWLEKSPKVGIRPQLVNTKTGRLEMDFLIQTSDRALHVLNSISPAFTSSFAVANHIVDQINV